MRSIVLALSVSALGAGCRTQGPARPEDGPPSLILHGGRIWTGDASRPEAAALAVRGERIAALGSDAEILALAGPGTVRFDLEGRLAVPGFIDSHLHFESGGEELLAPDLRSASSEEDFARRVGAYAASQPLGAWIRSGAWDHENWPGGREPTRALLDRFVPRHPVLIRRLDGHMAIANGLALQAAGITRATPDPAGGAIVRDPATGEPTGLLKDAAMDLVERAAPPPGRELRLDRLRAALRHAASLGVTGVHDMQGGGPTLDLYEELLARGELTLRVTLYEPLSAPERARQDPAPSSPRALWIRVNGFKGFADGSLGSSTALFFEPYLGEAENRGLALADLAPGGALETAVADLDRRGFQLAIHGIGDRAVRSLLDVFERVAGAGAKRRRFRIEHAQHIHPEDLGRFFALGAIASMQPYHAIDDGRWAEKRLDARRLETSYAWRDLLDRGATLAFGSDWPVAPLSPVLGIHAAATRSTLDGKHPDGWFPRQRISAAEALRAYTAGSAYAGFAESDAGVLAPGKLADLAVLDRDILDGPPEAIAKARVDATLAGGRWVFLRASNVLP
jgi:hypothetical protein